MKARYLADNGRGQSLNSLRAKADGRFPRTLAAAHLSLSVKAFDAGCARCNYRPTEWHHVGKYAQAVTFYDTGELAGEWEFWLGARSAYKAAKDRAECMAEALACRLALLAERCGDDWIDAHRRRSEKFGPRGEGCRRKFKFTRESELRDKYALPYNFVIRDLADGPALAADVAEYRAAQRAQASKNKVREGARARHAVLFAKIGARCWRSAKGNTCVELAGATFSGSSHRGWLFATLPAGAAVTRASSRPDAAGWAKAEFLVSLLSAARWVRAGGAA